MRARAPTPARAVPSSHAQLPRPAPMPSSLAPSATPVSAPFSPPAGLQLCVQGHHQGHLPQVLPQDRLLAVLRGQPGLGRPGRRRLPAHRVPARLRPYPPGARGGALRCAVQSEPRLGRAGPLRAAEGRACRPLLCLLHFCCTCLTRTLPACSGYRPGCPPTHCSPAPAASLLSVRCAGRGCGLRQVPRVHGAHGLPLQGGQARRPHGALPGLRRVRAGASASPSTSFSSRTSPSTSSSPAWPLLRRCSQR